MEKIEGVEWCQYCNDETEFCVDKDVWIIRCKCCGRPLVLCDKCHTMGLDENGCDPNCCHCVDCRKMLPAYKKELIGKRVWWNDPDNGVCSKFATISDVDFDEDTVTFEDGTEAMIWELDWDMKE